MEYLSRFCVQVAGMRLEGRASPAAPSTILVEEQELGAHLSMAGTTVITCARCHRQAEPLASPPLVGRRGELVQQHICPDCWQAWLEQSTLLINHYGIQVADPNQRRQLYTVMAEFLNLQELAMP